MTFCFALAENAIEKNNGGHRKYNCEDGKLIAPMADNKDMLRSEQVLVS